MTSTAIQQLINAMKEVFATKDDLKAMEERMDKKFAKQEDLVRIQSDLSIVKDLVVTAIPALLEWTDEIHQTIVKKDLDKRVTRLEHQRKPAARD